MEPDRTSGPTKRGSARGLFSSSGWRTVARRWWLVAGVRRVRRGDRRAAGGARWDRVGQPTTRARLGRGGLGRVGPEAAGPGGSGHPAPAPDQPARQAAEHRVRADRRPLDGPAPVHARGAGARGRAARRSTSYFVSDSLCCPSRASIFTGNFPHDTGVFTNTGRQGGFNVFHARGEQQHSFNVALQRAGYRTAMMGKYLNGYLETRQIDRSQHLRPAGLERMGRRRLGLSRIQLRAQPRRRRPLLRPSAARLSDQRAGAAGHAASSISSAALEQAVLPGAGDVRAPFAVHARAALPARLPGTDGARAAQLRRAADARPELAGGHRPLRPGTDPLHQPRVPQTRPGRPVGRRR